MMRRVTLMQQFARPHGVLGRFAGSVMAVVNAKQVAAVVDEVAPAQGEHVLEVGFGPGVGLRMLAARAPGVRVAGIDPSGDMVRAAGRRVRRVADRVDLREGMAAALPWADETFDAVCTTNSLQLWQPAQASLAEVLRVLRPGGRAVFSVGERAVLPDGGVAGPDYDQRLVPLLREVGFSDVRAEWRPYVRGIRILMVRARRPASPGC